VLLQGSGVIGERYYAGVRNDDSAAAHLALLEVGTAIALDNSLMGIGHSQFEDVSVGYAGQVSAEARSTGGLNSIGYYPPHNDFLLVWISWGLPGLITYTAMWLGAIGNCIRAALGTRDGLVRGAAVGTLGGLVAYAVNSAFHNYLDSSLLLWLCAGLSIALMELQVAADNRSRHTRTLAVRGVRRRIAANQEVRHEWTR
jgi:O-antigen ligase